jgi:hypothetical protein
MFRITENYSPLNMQLLNLNPFRLKPETIYPTVQFIDFIAFSHVLPLYFKHNCKFESGSEIAYGVVFVVTNMNR